ncbi:Hypothetical predicted protein [Olea europaea subsp. europaea]|uniref:Uncharacterized protein n=1 Tax=Olea europaea subsp. europaea TaxID=158383 RepID=A0A8S0PPF9_OLEEU|nr:Hypothetical predicted protein [Olea europaea subsp. europaea]
MDSHSVVHLHDEPGLGKRRQPHVNNPRRQQGGPVIGRRGARRDGLGSDGGGVRRNTVADRDFHEAIPVPLQVYERRNRRPLDRSDDGEHHQEVLGEGEGEFAGTGGQPRQTGRNVGNQRDGLDDYGRGINFDQANNFDQGINFDHQFNFDRRELQPVLKEIFDDQFKKLILLQRVQQPQITTTITTRMLVQSKIQHKIKEELLLLFDLTPKAEITYSHEPIMTLMHVLIWESASGAINQVIFQIAVQTDDLLTL